ncbi:M28 family peptidase [Massilia solisilvae]|uniref:M28 family peptidase n=1 Tax=Massilia solisilvae TaxID=1811225 RepID=A0ABT2BEX6_9BURK|nr:M28 family peptidase [Massilia solisilvae]MCS0607073.1 M28 family peptidase [Massilia solisilvae]
MRTFLATHWKVIVALAILVLLAVITMSPGAATPELAARLRTHVEAIASGEHNKASAVASYIEDTLAEQGYRVRRQQYQAGYFTACNVEVSLANLGADARPDRIFIIGARYGAAPGANNDGSGTAAVLELARLLKTMHPSRGTEIRFAFFVDDGSADSGNFIAFVGARASSHLVAQALAAFRAGPDLPAQGLAAPAYVQGLTLSGPGYPALMLTDTAFLRSPYYDTASDTTDKLDYTSMARAVAGLSRAIAALAGTTSG